MLDKILNLYTKDMIFSTDMLRSKFQNVSSNEWENNFVKKNLDYPPIKKKIYFHKGFPKVNLYVQVCETYENSEIKIQRK